MQPERASSGGNAARFRAVPERSPDFAHLSLDGLRSYRKALGTEEGRVSYWRRIIQARLDLIRASEGGAVASVETLRGVFAEARIDSGRNALIRIVPLDDIPPLPDLVDLWEREPVPGDTAHNTQLIADLDSAERQLSAYRTALHKRIAGATGELIARYRDEPLMCLSALPLPRERASSVAGA